MKTGNGLLLIAVMLAAIPAAWVRADDGFDYGVHLFRQGKNQAAIFELERALFSHADAQEAVHVRLLLGLAYARTGMYDDAASVLGELARDLENRTAGDRELDTEAAQDRELDNRAAGRNETRALLCETEFHILSIYFREKNFPDFFAERERLFFQCPDLDERLGFFANRMAIAARIYELDWDGALGELRGPGTAGDSLRAQIERIAGARNKSPVVGGVLSIIPGLGHLYAGRPGDGLRSLLINGTFATLAVFSYREDMPVLGSVFAVIEAIAYASNIYGGVNAVQQENARRSLEARDALLKEIPVPPLDVITVRGELPFR